MSDRGTLRALRINSEEVRRRQSRGAVITVLFLLAFAVAMVIFRTWLDDAQNRPAPQGTHGGVTVSP